MIRTARLGDFVRIRTGKLDANASVPDGEYPFFTCATESLRIDRFAYDCECILIAGNGDLNVKYFNGRFEAYQRTYIIESIDKSRLFPKFLFYFMSKYIEKLRRMSIGGVIKYIKLDYLTEVKIPYFDFDEQRRIADVLDRAEALRANRRTALAELDGLAQSIFIEMFGDPGLNPSGYPLISLGDLSIRFSDGPFGSNLKSSHYTQSGVRVVRLQNIGVGEFLDDDVVYISPEHFSSLSKHGCRPGDILIGTMGDPNLRACIQPVWLDLALNKADCVQMRPDSRICCAAYICSLLNHPSTERIAHDLLCGQTRLRISMGRLRNLSVPVPPLALQQEFARRVAAVEKLKAVQRASLAELDALFASLQDRAFRGAL